MLRPAERITNRGALVRTGSSDQRIGNFMKKRRRNAANFLYHLWGITSEVAAQRLENAPRMLQRKIALWETKAVISFVEPGPPIVAELLTATAGEKAGSVFFRVAKIFAQNAGRIGEVENIFAKE